LERNGILARFISLAQKKNNLVSKSQFFVLQISKKKTAFAMRIKCAFFTFQFQLNFLRSEISVSLNPPKPQKEQIKEFFISLDKFNKMRLNPD